MDDFRAFFGCALAVLIICPLGPAGATGPPEILLRGHAIEDGQKLEPFAIKEAPLEPFFDSDRDSAAVCPLPVSVDATARCPKGWKRSRILDGMRTCTPPARQKVVVHSEHFVNPDKWKGPRLPLVKGTCRNGALHGLVSIWDYTVGKYTTGQYVFGYRVGAHRVRSIRGWDDEGRVASARPRTPKPKRRDYEDRDEYQEAFDAWLDAHQSYKERVKASRERLLEVRCHHQLRRVSREGRPLLEMFIPRTVPLKNHHAALWKPREQSPAPGWYVINMDQGYRTPEPLPYWKIDVVEDGGVLGKKAIERAIRGCAQSKPEPCLMGEVPYDGKTVHDVKTGACVATRASCKRLASHVNEPYVFRKGECVDPSARADSAAAPPPQEAPPPVSGLAKGEAPAPAPTPLVGLKAIDASDDLTCAVRADNRLVCWGPGAQQSETPDAKFQSIAVGAGHGCGILEDGSVSCWGDNIKGQSRPPKGAFFALVAGGQHTCGIKTNGRVACWGGPTNRQGKRVNQANAPDSEFQSLSAGTDHTCGITVDGGIECWGSDEDGRSSPPWFGEYKSVGTGYARACAVKTDGEAVCWGRSGLFKETEPPARRWHAVAVGYQFACGILAAPTPGEIECWGFMAARSRKGKLEDLVLPKGPFVQLISGGSHFCGLRVDGSVACWGDDENGQSTPPMATQ